MAIEAPPASNEGWRLGLFFDPTKELERLRILAGRYFLLKISGNAGVGETWRCHRCKGKHSFMTLMCVERPFQGLEGALLAFYKHVADTGAYAAMNPVQLARYRRMERFFQPVKELPTLASRHPRMARSLAISDRDMEMGALALGVVDPIPEEYARKLVDKINGRGLKPKLIIPGLNAPLPPEMMPVE